MATRRLPQGWADIVLTSCFVALGHWSWVSVGAAGRVESEDIHSTLARFTVNDWVQGQTDGGGVKVKIRFFRFDRSKKQLHYTSLTRSRFGFMVWFDHERCLCLTRHKLRTSRGRVSTLQLKWGLFHMSSKGCEFSCWRQSSVTQNNPSVNKIPLSVTKHTHTLVQTNSCSGESLSSSYHMPYIP